MNPNFEKWRTSIHRSRHGKVLGVFSGIAESRGYSVCRTRWIGVILLLFIASCAGAHGVKVMFFVSGFFYLLSALLMQPPRTAVGGGSAGLPSYGNGNPPPMPGSSPRYRRGAVPTPSSPYRPRPDFAALDRQLDGLSRRIERMETIVTDRQYDWDRRMDS